MRHLKAGRKLNRTSAHRKALLRNLVTSLLQHEHLQTTDAKAKEMRRWVDRMAAFVRGRDIVKKLFDDIAPRFASRPGGYTRITKLGSRHGDSAPVSLIELVERSDRARSEAEKKRERRIGRDDDDAQGPPRQQPLQLPPLLLGITAAAGDEKPEPGRPGAALERADQGREEGIGQLGHDAADDVTHRPAQGRRGDVGAGAEAGHRLLDPPRQLRRHLAPAAQHVRDGRCRDIRGLGHVPDRRATVRRSFPRDQARQSVNRFRMMTDRDPALKRNRAAPARRWSAAGRAGR